MAAQDTTPAGGLLDADILPRDPVKVFIASTTDDLKVYRSAVADVVLDHQWHPIAMEHFPADPRPVVSFCRSQVAESDLVVLLQAFRRGWVPPPEAGGDGRTSITAWEIAIAEELGKPVLASKVVCQTFGGSLPEGVIQADSAQEHVQVLAGLGTGIADSIRTSARARFSWAANLAVLDGALARAIATGHSRSGVHPVLPSGRSA